MMLVLTHGIRGKGKRKEDDQQERGTDAEKAEANEVLEERNGQMERYG